MASAPVEGAFGVSVVTPLGPVVHADVDSVIAPGALGEFEVLRGHVPFLTELHAGVLRLGNRKSGEPSLVFAVSRGFLEVEPGGAVQVLAEQAIAKGDIDVEATQTEIADSDKKVSSWEGDIDAEYQTLRERLAFARARLRASQT